LTEPLVVTYFWNNFMSKKVLALMTGVLLSTTAPAIANDYPPFIPAPADAAPVFVTIELVAKDPSALERHLNSAKVIPTTRLASGINYSWTMRDRNNPKRFLLIQQWNSVAQQQGYIAWRTKRGNLAQLRAFLSKDPIVTYLNPIDLMALPSQTR
jgi:quinol monooxygenase YgiN